jgi:hypothetical protein
MGSALTKEDRNNLIAMSIGDGHIHPNGQLMISHGLDQYDFCYYKYSLIKSVCSVPKLRKYFHNQVQKEVKEYYMQTKRLKFLRLFRKILYPFGKKRISIKILNRIGLQGLAILWMDDGNRWIRFRPNHYNSWDVSGRLFLCLDKDQSQLFLDWIKEEYNIDGYMVVKGENNYGKYYTIMFNGRQLQKLSNLLRQYIIPQMEYKINPIIVGQDGKEKDSKICSYKEMIRIDEVGSTPLKAQIVRSARLAKARRDSPSQEEILEFFGT